MHRRIHPRFWLLIIALMLVAFSVSHALAQRSLLEGEEALHAIRSYRQNLQENVDDLRSELEFAQTDDYVIRVARGELGMIMPGDIRYVSGD